MNTYSALSFDRINFFNMENLRLLSRKAFVMGYCFRTPIKTFFFDACQMTVKSCVLHLFPVPQTGRSHIMNILCLVFSVRAVNYGSSFFSIDLWLKREIDGKKLGPQFTVRTENSANKRYVPGPSCSKAD